MRIRLGTRQSQLARWQADWVASQLRALGAEVEMVPIITEGDVSTKPLGEVGGQGLFTKEIQRALLDNRCDLAVHSLKDLPTMPIDGLCLAAVPERESVGDALISRGGETFDQLKQGAVIGTGSTRRVSQLLCKRPDLQTRDIRGNLDTRLKKLDDGQYDAILLAVAGLKRLGWGERITEELSIDWMMPAVGQAALGLETRSDDKATRDFIGKLSHGPSMSSVLAERSLLQALRAGCLAPVAALARCHGSVLRLKARVLALDGSRSCSTSVEGPIDQAVELGLRAAELLTLAGGTELIRASRC